MLEDLTAGDGVIRKSLGDDFRMSEEGRAMIKALEKFQFEVFDAVINKMS
jgi:hypothetical protein